MTIVDIEDVKAKSRQPRSVDVGELDPADFTGPVRAAGSSLYPVPVADDFDFGTAEFKPDKALKALAGTLIDRHPDLAHVKMLDVRFMWKRKGGESGGKAVYGKCVKPGGLLRHALSAADFVIWLAADQCQGFTRHQVEALLYHELCHIGRDEDGKRSLVPHDVEAFASEVREYGLWMSDLRTFGKAVRQLALDEAE